MKQYTKYECINSYLSYVIYFLPFVVATLSGILPKKMCSNQGHYENAKNIWHMKDKN